VSIQSLASYEIILKHSARRRHEDAGARRGVGNFARWRAQECIIDKRLPPDIDAVIISILLLAEIDRLWLALCPLHAAPLLEFSP